MAIKKNLLELTQLCLSSIDADDVNSIDETLEAQQVVDIIEGVFYNIITNREVPSTQELIKLEPLSNSEFPTYFRYPDNVKAIEKVWYDKSDDNTFDYAEVCWLDPLDFLAKTDRYTDDTRLVNDKNAGVKLKIGTDHYPRYYTSFDNEHIVMDSFDANVDNTLQQSKVRAFGVKIPVFDKNDDLYVPDLSEAYFPYFINECMSLCWEILKGGTTPKMEQNVRRQKNWIQNDKHKTKKQRSWNAYGRR